MRMIFRLPKTLFLTLLAAGSLSSGLFAQGVKLTKKWETTGGLKVPESVIYDADKKVLYVANINGDGAAKDGNGFISTLSLSGKIENEAWVKGLDGPKGMGIYKGKLYVSDITKVAVIDIATGKIEKTYEVDGAKFLNDVTVRDNGEVYISDSDTKKVYLLKDNKIALWLDNPILQKPNGLLALKDALRLIDMSSGKFYTVSYTDKKLTATAENIPSGDGIVEIGPDEFLISNWNGEITYLKGNKTTKILDTKEFKINAADIWYVPAQKLVLVPTFFGNNVVAYELSK
jgi:DNA-binding beta-propeller fold protein YncE